HVRQGDERSGHACGDHRHRAVVAPRDDPAPLEWIEREVDSAPAEADNRVLRERSLLGPDHDAPLDRQLAERARHARRRGLFRPPLAGTAEPASRSERGPLRRARERLAHARLHLLDLLLFDPLLHRLRHTRSSCSAAAPSTSSITAPTVSSTPVFSITGTPSARARSTMKSWS